MTTTTAERTTQALTISELISAMAEVQKLIASHDKDCYWGIITVQELGKSYYSLAETLRKATGNLLYGL